MWKEIPQTEWTGIKLSEQNTATILSRIRQRSIPFWRPLLPWTFVQSLQFSLSQTADASCYVAPLIHKKSLSKFATVNVLVTSCESSVKFSFQIFCQWKKPDSGKLAIRRDHPRRRIKVPSGMVGGPQAVVVSFKFHQNRFTGFRPVGSKTAISHSIGLWHIHHVQKKGDTKLMAVIPLILNRFSDFFHCPILQ